MVWSSLRRANFNRWAAALMAAAIAAPPAACANDPGLVGTFGRRESSFRAEPVGNRQYNERVSEPLQRGRYTEDNVPPAAEAAKTRLYDRPVQVVRTLKDDFSVGNMGDANALSLSAAGRTEVSAFLMPIAEKTGLDGTAGRSGGGDHLNAMVQIVAAKIVRGEAVTPAESRVMATAAAADDVMTAHQGKPQTTLSRVAAIAANVQNFGKASNTELGELRSVLDHSAFYPRVNAGGALTSIGATLVGSRAPTATAAPVVASAPPVTTRRTTTGGPAANTGTTNVAPPITAGQPAATTNPPKMETRELIGEPRGFQPELRGDPNSRGMTLPQTTAITSVPEGTSGTTGSLPPTGTNSITSVPGGGLPPTTASLPMPGTNAATSAPAAATQPGGLPALPMPIPNLGATARLPDPAANLPIPRGADWSRLDATLAAKLATPPGVQVQLRPHVVPALRTANIPAATIQDVTARASANPALARLLNDSKGLDFAKTFLTSGRQDRNPAMLEAIAAKWTPQTIDVLAKYLRSIDSN